MGSNLLSIVLLGVLGLAALIVYTRFVDAPAHTDPAIPIPYTTKEGSTMLTEAPATPKAIARIGTVIPPIDLAAPKKTETATFALG